MKTDLFPETLLVDVADGHTFTTSLKIAEHFDKRHDDVLRAIRKIVARCAPERLRNFTESFALFSSSNGAKRKRPIFNLTRDGFDFVVKGFTGAKADEWNWKFIDAFNQMEAQLRAKTELAAAALYQLRPVLAPVIDGTERGLSRSEIGAGIDRSNSSVTRTRRTARRLGLLPQVLRGHMTTQAA